MSDFKFSPEPFLDSDQAAAILRIHPKTLQRLARCGQQSGRWAGLRRIVGDGKGGVKHNSPSIEGLNQWAISDWGIMGT
jgi:hypothetical protein